MIGPLTNLRVQHQGWASTHWVSYQGPPKMTAVRSLNTHVGASHPHSCIAPFSLRRFPQRNLWATVVKSKRKIVKTQEPGDNKCFPQPWWGSGKGQAGPKNEAPGMEIPSNFPRICVLQSWLWLSFLQFLKDILPRFSTFDSLTIVGDSKVIAFRDSKNRQHQKCIHFLFQGFQYVLIDSYLTCWQNQYLSLNAKQSNKWCMK